MTDLQGKEGAAMTLRVSEALSGLGGYQLPWENHAMALVSGGLPGFERKGWPLRTNSKSVLEI